MPFFVGEGAVFGPAAGVTAAAFVSQVFTPPWPEQAPLFELPENAVPSLQVAATVAGVPGEDV